MSQTTSSSPELPARNPSMALTALGGAMACIGVGHLLVGRFRRGILWALITWAVALLAVLAAIFCAPVPVIAALIVLAAVLQLAALVDAVVCGRHPARYWGRWWSRGLVAGGIFLASLWVNPWLATAIAMRFRESCEAFVLSSNAMLPTIAGLHTADVCPHCGAQVLLADSYPTTDDSSVVHAIGLCQECGEFVDDRAHSRVNSFVLNPDRFLVNKRIHPQRWDLIVFPCPDDPGELYVMRLVGLPGERVELSGRDVKIDGEVLAKPPELQFLHYVDNPRAGWWPGWGQEGNAVTLAHDEVFVLGDFSPRANDSRGWAANDSGHAAYAVPTDSIVGIATHIYWPPSRWRLFPRYAAK